MIVSEIINVAGMLCVGCETILEETIVSIDGIQQVKADYRKGKINVVFDPTKTSLSQIYQAILAKGYIVAPKHVDVKQKKLKIAFSILALLILFAILMISRNLGHQIILPEINPHASDGLIFIVGLLTGLHCVGMCGSFIIGYTAKDAEHHRPAFRSHLLYGTGKTISYILFGAFFGVIGSLFQITPLIGGISIGLAGAFLVLYGLNMLKIFSFLKSINIKQPRFLYRFVNKNNRKSSNPFFIGIFSGFILGCGPLQAMYIMAAGNGSMLEGAKILALFGIGTLPALIGFGFIARLLSNRMARNIIHASGIILIVLGSLMFYKGIIRSGIIVNEKTEQHKSCCQAPDFNR